MRFKNLHQPDEEFNRELLRTKVVHLGDWTVELEIDEPGWRWSTHMKHLRGTDWCQARHVGVVLSGRQGVLLSDGSTFEIGPYDVYDMPPGHDAWTIGDEPAIHIVWTGFRTWIGPEAGTHDRVLASLLFTDIVDSTAEAQRVGDSVWRERLAEHYEAMRRAIAGQGGEEVDTTGDGMMAAFAGPAAALECADLIRAMAARVGLRVRAGVHVGEVSRVGKGLRGVAIHEAARVMAAAAPDEILVTETTKVLAATSGARFEDRGLHSLKGFEGERRLFAYVSDSRG